jgi:DNA repair protein RecO (recombination protein O)
MLIEEAFLKNPHTAISETVQGMAYAAYVLELVRELAPEEQDSAGLFDVVLLFFALLDYRGPREDLLWLFVLRLIKTLGVAPLFVSCVRCRKNEKESPGSLFIPESGGIVCDGCRSPYDRGVELSLGTKTALAAALDIPLDRLSRIVLGESSLIQTRQAMFSFIDHQLGRRMRSADFMERYIR